MHYVDTNFAGKEDDCAQVQSFIRFFCFSYNPKQLYTHLLLNLGRAILNQANLSRPKLCMKKSHPQTLESK
jgi:hypothetical protein